MKNLLTTNDTATLGKLIRYPAVVVIVASLIWVSACQPDESRKPQPVTGSITLNFINVADEAEIELDKTIFKNAAGNQYEVSLLQYYISNISLKGCECGPFEEEESYHLIRMLDDPNLGGFVNEHKIVMDSVQIGKYNEIEFSVGVDEIRNSLKTTL